jgi:hypothetical protein
MPDLRIENVPADLIRELKIKAATDGVTLRQLVIMAAEKIVGRKAGKA